MLWHFMQIVSIGDNFYEMLNPIFWENKKISIFICWISLESGRD